jgi:hypothetical protein
MEIVGDLKFQNSEFSILPSVYKFRISPGWNLTIRPGQQRWRWTPDSFITPSLLPSVPILLSRYKWECVTKR